MGHFHTEITGIGKNKEEALSNAESEFFHENGNRHSKRGIEASKFIKKVPPKKMVTTEEVGTSWDGRRCKQKTMRYEECPNAPQSEWLEEWEFVLHTHA